MQEQDWKERLRSSAGNLDYAEVRDLYHIAHSSGSYSRERLDYLGEILRGKMRRNWLRPIPKPSHRPGYRLNIPDERTREEVKQARIERRKR